MNRDNMSVLTCDLCEAVTVHETRKVKGYYVEVRDPAEEGGFLLWDLCDHCLNRVHAAVMAEVNEIRIRRQLKPMNCPDAQTPDRLTNVPVEETARDHA